MSAIVTKSYNSCSLCNPYNHCVDCILKKYPRQFLAQESSNGKKTIYCVRVFFPEGLKYCPITTIEGKTNPIMNLLKSGEIGLDKNKFLIPNGFADLGNHCVFIQIITKNSKSALIKLPFDHWNALSYVVLAIYPNEKVKITTMPVTMVNYLLSKLNKFKGINFV